MYGESDVTGPKAGDRVGAYELLCPIGRGGFAVVWLARLRGKHGFEKLVAIKTIRPELAADEAFDRMFIAEARITAAIEHPNVARVVDFGDEKDALFLVMEYVSGDSLSALRRAVYKRNEPFPIDIAVGIVAATCAGLHAAHELMVEGRSLGVIHRDVSPQNILVSDAGIPKLVDFGIAKASDGLSAETMNGVPKGKPRYMAPEQVMPRMALDRRVDVWAAGAVLYELLEGRPALDLPNDMARVHALVSGQPIPPFTRDVPPEIADVVMQALSHDREARFPTALELGEALLDGLATSGPRVSHADIAAFCDSVLPGKRAERETMTRRALSAAAERVARPASSPEGRERISSSARTPDGAVLVHDASEVGPAWDVGAQRGAAFAPTSLRKRLWTWGPLGVAAVLFVAALTIAARKPTTEAVGAAPRLDVAPTSLPASAVSGEPSSMTAAPEPPVEHTPQAEASNLAPARPTARTAVSARAAAGATASPHTARAVRPTPPPGRPATKRVDDQIQ